MALINENSYFLFLHFLTGGFQNKKLKFKSTLGSTFIDQNFT